MVQIYDLKVKSFAAVCYTSTMPKNILMCAPTYFDIEYEINPWMHVADQPSDLTAEQQWQKLHDLYVNELGWNVQLINPVKHLPDMVFATDCCLMIDGKIMLSSFATPNANRKPLNLRPGSGRMAIPT